MDARALHEWLAALDAITYYELFGADPGATHDELHAAFRAFAESFHPDGHLGRPPAERDAIGRIYRRGAEAWRVLSDPGLRARYDRAVAEGVARPDELVAAEAGGRAAAAAVRLVDQVRSARARPFVVRAEELLQNGDPRQAKIQLVMAMHIEGPSAALEAFAARLEETLKTRTGDPSRR